MRSIAHPGSRRSESASWSGRETPRRWPPARPETPVPAGSVWPIHGSGLLPFGAASATQTRAPEAGSSRYTADRAAPRISTAAWATRSVTWATSSVAASSAPTRASASSGPAGAGAGTGLRVAAAGEAARRRGGDLRGRGVIAVTVVHPAPGGGVNFSLPTGRAGEVPSWAGRILMTYDFDRVIDRRHTESSKWRKYDSDVLPMWVADMDFPAPEPVIRALSDRVEHGVFGYVLEQPEFHEVIVDRLRTGYGGG